MADAYLGRPKYPDERFSIAWDFIDDLDADDSLDEAECSVEAENQDGDDLTVTVLEGDNVFETQLRVTLKAGTAGDTIFVRFIGVTAAGSQFERVVLVRVRA